MPTDTTLQAGARVRTPLGAGTVVYTRNGPPDYATPTSVSVRLDKRSHDPRYTGTMFSASEVAEDPTWDPTDERRPGPAHYCRTCGTRLNDDSTCNTCCV
jgi:hypothetical protein